MVRNSFTPDRRGVLRLIAGGTVGATLPVAFETPAFAAGKRVGLVVKNLGNSYFDACADGAREAAKQIGGMEIIYTAPTKPTAEDQIAVLDALIAQKVDGLIVSADDANALVPIGKKAAERGIKVISFDSAIAKGGRIMHLDASSTPLIGAIQVQMIAKTLKNEGEVAILSASSTMTNQNSWIEAMKEEWKKPEYAKMPLVATVYGDDQDDKSYREMQALAKAHPNLKGVISPTTIGIRSGAKAIMDGGLVGKIYITGLGLPSEMKEAVLKGACDSFAIWNPVDYGYAATQIMGDILAGASADARINVEDGPPGRHQGRRRWRGRDGQAVCFRQVQHREIRQDFLSKFSQDRRFATTRGGNPGDSKCSRRNQTRPRSRFPTFPRVFLECGRFGTSLSTSMPDRSWRWSARTEPASRLWSRS